MMQSQKFPIGKTAQAQSSGATGCLLGRLVANGYTLIELLAVLAIMGLMIALAPPVLQSQRIGIQTKSAAYRLVAQLNAAHEEAVNSQRTVHVQLPSGSEVKFFPDGSATGIVIPEARFNITVAPISGQVSVDD